MELTDGLVWEAGREAASLTLWPFPWAAWVQKGIVCPDGENWRRTTRFEVVVGIWFRSSAFQMLSLGSLLNIQVELSKAQLVIQSRVKSTWQRWAASAFGCYWMRWPREQMKIKKDRVLGRAWDSPTVRSSKDKMTEDSSLGGKRQTRAVCCPEAGEGGRGQHLLEWDDLAGVETPEWNRPGFESWLQPFSTVLLKQVSFFLTYILELMISMHALL